MTHTWRVGEVVFVQGSASDGNEEPRRGVITAVGRKWFTVEDATLPWVVRQFAIDSGREKSDGIGGYRYAMTPERATEERNRNIAISRAQKANALSWEWSLRATADEINAVCDIVERVNARYVRESSR